MDDYYNVLGIARNASKDEIKRAYKDLAKRHHPDKGGDAETFKKINEAYGVLSDDSLRARYDQFGKDGMQGVDMSGFDFDFFNMFPMRRQQRQTKDRVMNLEVTLEEAFHGTTVKFRFKRKIFSGDAPVCAMCSGKGQVVEQMTTNIGFIQNVRLCPACAGVGTAVREDQFQSVIEVISIDIPPHCPLGQQILIRGKSDEMPNMETGNLILHVIFKAHPELSVVQKKDLLWKVRIHPVEALTSFSREVKLPSGEHVVISHKSGERFLSEIHKWKIVPGKGMFGVNGERGNMIVRFELEEFSFQENDKALLERLASREFPPVSQGISISALSSCDPFSTRESSPSSSKQTHPNVQECRPS